MLPLIEMRKIGWGGTGVGKKSRLCFKQVTFKMTDKQSSEELSSYLDTSLELR